MLSFRSGLQGNPAGKHGRVGEGTKSILHLDKTAVMACGGRGSVCCLQTVMCTGYKLPQGQVECLDP